MSKMYEALQRAQQQGMGAETPIAESIEAADSYTDAPSPYCPEAPYCPETQQNQAEPHKDAHTRLMPISAPADSVAIPWSGAMDPGASEQYRIIRTRIVQHPKHPKALLITSANAADGKTVSAINIAGALALRDDAKVLLIDADLRRTRLCGMLGLPAGLGLANILAGNCALQEAIIRIEQYPNFYVLPAGSSKINPAELFDSKVWESVIASVREHFDFVVMDGPPVAGIADYELIQAKCDGVVVVVRPDHTDRTLVMKTFELVPASKMLGIVLNCASHWFLSRTEESYYYRSGVK